MKRIVMMLTVALVMAAMVVAMAAPAFADSFVSDLNEFEDGPNSGANYGHCKKLVGEGPREGQTTAEFSPSYHGGKDEQNAFNAITCGSA